MTTFKDLKFSVILDEIKKSFFEYGFYSTSFSEKATDIVAYYVTPFFLQLRLSANLITVISLIITAWGAVVTAKWGLNGWPLGLFLYAVATLLDHVDGRVARETGTASFYGKFIDGFVGIFNISFIRLALFWVIYYEYGLCWLTLAAFICFFMTPFYVFMYDRYSAFARWINESKNLKIQPYIRRKEFLKPANVVVDIERLALLWSLTHFAEGMWIYLLINLILEIGFIIFHLRSAYVHMRIPN